MSAYAGMHGMFSTNECKEAHMALMSAAMRGHVDVAAILLAKGARVDAKSPCGKMTPLLYACKYNHTPMIALLLTHHAEPDVCYRGSHRRIGVPTKFMAPLHFALMHRNIEAVKLLVRVAWTRYGR